MASPAQIGEVGIEAGHHADLDGVVAIMNAAFDPQFGEAWTRSQCAGILPMSGVTLLVARAHELGEPLGFALFRIIAQEAELLLLGVAPASGRRGIGRRLLDEFVERARRGGARRVHLEVRDGNPAISMYHTAGFTAAGRRRNYYRGPSGDQFDALTLSQNI